MVRGKMEFRLGLVGVILGGLVFIGSFIGALGVILFASTTYYNDIFSLEKYAMIFTYQDFSYVVLEVLLIILLACCLLFFISFIIGLIGILYLRKGALTKGGILLLISGCLGNILTMIAGISTLGKNARWKGPLDGRRDIEFALILIGGILLLVSFVWVFFSSNFSSLLNQVTQNYVAHYFDFGPHSYCIVPLGDIVGSLIRAILGIGAMVISVLMRRKKVDEDAKVLSIWSIVIGILGLNPFIISGGIIGLTKRGTA